MTVIQRISMRFRTGRASLRLFATLLLGFGCMSTSAIAEPERPNIVIFLADDLGWADVGYRGSPIETASIDRLAEEGVRLERFYATPICSPTRAALMTARDPIRLGIAYDQIHPWYNAGLDKDEYTLAEAFQDAGYQTALIGKWHLGHTQEHQLPNAQGFDEFWGHVHTNTDFYDHKREGGHDLQHNGESVHEPGEYLTHLEAREALRFIRERDEEKPFLLYVPFTAPHSPMQAPQGTIDKYAGLPEKDYRRTYAAMVDEMDRAMGQVLAELESEGLADNTVVLFFSDNGGFHGFGGNNEPLRGQKGQTFEGGIRVPAVIRWPGRLQANQAFDDMMSVLDVMPTLAAAAGVELPADRQIDGENRWPALLGQPVPRKAPLFFVSEIPVPGMIFTAVIDWPWKLVQIVREGQTSTETREMLFQIDRDPNEQNDLASSEPEKVAHLAALLRQRRAEHPLAGTRGTLVPHPGWIPAKDWAEAVSPGEHLQDQWRNELPFDESLIRAIGDRGRLVDEETRARLRKQEREREKAWQQGGGER